MSVVPRNWRLAAGDPEVFSLEIAFHPGEELDVGPPEALSWGSFQLWVKGRNVCAHREEGEELASAHWYLLSLLEWLANNWDPLLHEERLPILGQGSDAATSLEMLSSPPPDPSGATGGRIADDVAWVEEWQQWSWRHSLRTAAEGGLFPDVHLRRWGDLLEVSVGQRPPAGAPDHVAFLEEGITARVQVEEAAQVILYVASKAAEHLALQLPDDHRCRDLATAWQEIASGETRELRQLAWLAGAGEDADHFLSLWAAAAEASGQMENPTRVLQGQAGEPAIVRTPVSAALFGSYAPTITEEDVMNLLLLSYERGPGRDARGPLGEVAAQLGSHEALTPGEQGSYYGEEAHEVLRAAEGDTVDVASILDSLGIEMRPTSLTDQRTRAVSLLRRDGTATIALNHHFEHGRAAHVTRFSLAHELAHLLLDRGRASELGIVSGPWAPLEIEQRANAFAAAFLMPQGLLRRVAARMELRYYEFDGVAELAGVLQVSVVSLADRLYNLGWLDRHQVEEIRARAGSW